MPKYDFAHPKFNHGFVEFSIKEEPLFEKFCNIARTYRANVIKSQMVISSRNFTAKIFNRMSYLEIKRDGKSTIIRNENDIRNFFIRNF